jgi:cation/acetate symporter
MSGRSISLLLFGIFVLATLWITYWASRRTRTATDFYAAGRRITGFQNGIAIAGDYMSAASFLGIAGLIALFGFDGYLYSVGFLVAYLVVLLLVAELLRNSGKYTMADVLAYRLRQAPVRSAAALSTVGVSIVYLIAQMVGAGALFKLLLGLTGDGTAIAAIAAVGVLMIIYVTFGGMIGTTWVQIIKAVLLLGGTVLLSLFVLGKFGFSLNALFGEAAKASGKGDAFLAPGLRFKNNGVELVSLGLALVLGTAGLPHILVRFYTVPTARAARTSVNWAIGLIGGFYILTTFLGFGAAALVGSAAVKKANPGGNMAAPLLAEKVGGGADTIGGDLFLAFIAAVAFATILAVVAGLTITASSSFAHDFYANVIKRGQRDEAREVRIARITALVIGAIAIVLGAAARNLNVAFLVGLAFAVAASANLPTILFSLYWKRFNTIGAVVGILVGLFSCLILVAIGPTVIGPTGLWLKGTDPIFPWENPGIVSIPLGFAAAWLGTLVSREPSSEQRFEELRARAFTGVGAEEVEALAPAPASAPAVGD